MANFLSHTSCDKCGSRDNLAMYDDGSAFCFGCGHYVPPDLYKVVQDQVQKPTVKEEQKGGSTRNLPMPDDVDTYYPSIALDWFKSCGLNIQDMSVLRCLWSESKQWLIFPFRDANLRLISWQARSFQKDTKRKYFSQGTIHDLVHVYKGYKDEYLTLVEGVLDAYKVYKAGWSSMPIFGSSINPVMANRLRLLGHDKIRLWLDADKYPEAVKFKRMLETTGFQDVELIYNVNDPKNSVISEVLV